MSHIDHTHDEPTSPDGGAQQDGQLGSRRHLDFSPQLARTGWYHSFEGESLTADGVQSLTHQRGRFDKFGIQSKLHGATVIDIGAWDGWFSFECERHGAAVTAVDCVDIANFRQAHYRLGSAVEYVITDLYELPKRQLKPADFVLFLGVLYHVRHPLAALRIVAALTLQAAIVESYVIDGDSFHLSIGKTPLLEYYELDDLGGHLDNWFGPTVSALMAMCRSSGFASVRLLDVKDSRAVVECNRQWHRESNGTRRIVLHSVCHAQNYGINFSSDRDDYVSAWFSVEDGLPITLSDVQPEVGQFGSIPIYLGRQEDGQFLVNFMLPPGLGAGWLPVRICLATGEVSDSLSLALDVSALSDKPLIINGICDGETWSKEFGRIGGTVSVWVAGLPANADIVVVQCYSGSMKLPVIYVGPVADGLRQVNASVPDWFPIGEHQIRIELGNDSSTPVTFQLRRAV